MKKISVLLMGLFLLQLANAHYKARYHVIVDTAGITDATSAQQADSRIAAVSVCLPRRYSHSPVELLDLRDLEALIRLLTVSIPAIDSADALKRL